MPLCGDADTTARRVERCSQLADEGFRRDRLRSMVWLTLGPDGGPDGLSWFNTPCEAPARVNDAAVLKTLCDDQHADFVYDRVTAYAMAFVGNVTFVGTGLAILAKPPSVRRVVVVIEAHDGRDSIVGTREIDGARLGPLQKHERATARFGGLLAARAERDVRRGGGQPGVWPH